MNKLYSIIIYLMTFVVSLFFIYRAEKAIRKNRKQSYRMNIAVAVALPCLLAALRGLYVGTDTKGYYELYETAFSYNSLEAYVARMSLRDLEVGYSTFMFVLSRFHLSKEIFFFILALMSILPVVYVLSKYRDNFPMWIGMAVYYAFFYNLSFNATRQCIAVSFILLVYQMITEKKYKLAFLFFLIALSFHSSAYVGLVFVFAAIIFRNIKMSFVRQIIVCLVIMILAVAPFYLDRIFSLLGNLGLASDRQLFYQQLFAGEKQIEGSVGLGEDGYVTIVLRIVCLLIPGIALLVSKKIKNPSNKASFIVILMGTIFYITTAIAFNTIHVYRITMYPEIFYVLYLPTLYRVVYKRRNALIVNLKSIIFLGIILLYWYLIFIKYGHHQTGNYFML